MYYINDAETDSSLLSEWPYHSFWCGKFPLRRCRSGNWTT